MDNLLLQEKVIDKNNPNLYMGSHLSIFCHVRPFKHCMLQGILCHDFHWHNMQQTKQLFVRCVDRCILLQRNQVKLFQRNK